MGQLIAALFRAIVVALFLGWMYFIVFPHPDRRVIALAMLPILAVVAWAGVGLGRDLMREYPVAPSAPGHRLAAMEPNIMEETKPWYLSRGVVGGAVSAVAGAAQLAGYTLTPADQAALIDGATQAYQLVFGVGSLVGGLIAIWGRIKASKAIGSTKAA